jgi:predicted molibdopterin-dependent oxidoreductase YjgC
MAVSDRTWERLVEADVGNTNHRLYGGSQYHRTLREFHLAARCLRTPTIAEDEIANAAGMGETHDGVNFLHAACVIAVESSRLTRTLVSALSLRMAHVMDRPVTEYMLRGSNDQKGLFTTRLDTRK